MTIKAPVTIVRGRILNGDEVKRIERISLGSLSKSAAVKGFIENAPENDGIIADEIIKEKRDVEILNYIIH